MALAQEEVEAWGSVRDRFSLRTVSLGLVLGRNLVQLCNDGE